MPKNAAKRSKTERLTASKAGAFFLDSCSHFPENPKNLKTLKKFRNKLYGIQATES